MEYEFGRLHTGYSSFSGSLKNAFTETRWIEEQTWQWLGESVDCEAWRSQVARLHSNSAPNHRSCSLPDRHSSWVCPIENSCIQTNVFTLQNRIELTWQGIQWPILWVCEWVQLKCRIGDHSHLPESSPFHLHWMRIPLTCTSSSMQANLLAKTGMPAPNMSTTFMGKSRPEVLVCRDTPISAAARMIG